MFNTPEIGGSTLSKNVDPDLLGSAQQFFRSRPEGLKLVKNLNIGKLHTRFNQLGTIEQHTVAPDSIQAQPGEKLGLRTEPLVKTP